MNQSRCCFQLFTNMTICYYVHKQIMKKRSIGSIFLEMSSSTNNFKQMVDAFYPADKLYLKIIVMKFKTI